MSNIIVSNKTLADWLDFSGAKNNWSFNSFLYNQKDKINYKTNIISLDSKKKKGNP